VYKEAAPMLSVLEEELGC